MTPALAPDARERLTKILGRLGSDHPGERAAAGLKADQLVRGLGLTWSDVLAPRPPAPSWPPCRRWIEPETDQDAAAQCLRWPECLTSWEREFCASLLNRWKVTPRQRRVLNRLITKCRNFSGGEGFGDD